MGLFLWERSLKMGTIFCQNNPQNWVQVSRLERHTPVQTKSEYPSGYTVSVQTVQARIFKMVICNSLKWQPLPTGLSQLTLPSGKGITPKRCFCFLPPPPHIKMTAKDVQYITHMCKSQFFFYCKLYLLYFKMSVCSMPFCSIWFAHEFHVTSCKGAVQIHCYLCLFAFTYINKRL